MKIAIISTMEAVPWGGSEELWARLAEAALGHGHQVALFIHRWPALPAQVRALEQRGAQVHLRGHSYRLPAERMAARVLRRRVRLAAPAALSPFRDLARFAPDVVLLSEGTLFSFVHIADAREWLARSGTPFVCVCQYLSDAYRVSEELRAQALDFYGRAFHVGFVAGGNLATAERLLAGSLPNGGVVRNPVNLRAVGPLPEPPPGPVRMAAVARLTTGDKGQDVLLQALGAPAWRGRDWRLNLYGTGADEGYLRALAAHYRVADRVEFRGQVDDIRALWADNHLLVMPSRAEGTPLALVEAMLCARPAVATDVGGIAEWVTEGETGFLAEAPTARSFGAALERAWTARERWGAVGRRAYEVALRQYDPAPGETMLAMLADAAARGRRGE